MGAKVASSKSFKFATHRKVKQWLGEKTRENVCSKVDVVDDPRYLGAQVTTTYDVISGTLETRWGKPRNSLNVCDSVRRESRQRLGALQPKCMQELFME